MAMEQRAPQPQLGRKCLESRFVACRLAGVESIDDLLQDRPLLARLIRDRGEIVDHVRIELRQHGAHTIAKKTRIGIRAVDSRNDFALTQERLDLRARDFEQGTDDAIRANRMNSTQPGKSAARHESHQDGLGLIVLLMCGRDMRRAGFAPNFLKVRMADIACRRFDAVAADLIGI